MPEEPLKSLAPKPLFKVFWSCTMEWRGWDYRFPIKQHWPHGSAVRPTVSGCPTFRKATLLPWDPMYPQENCLMVRATAEWQERKEELRQAGIKEGFHAKLLSQSTHCSDWFNTLKHGLDGNHSKEDSQTSRQNQHKVNILNSFLSSAICPSPGSLYPTEDVL